MKHIYVVALSIAVVTGAWAQGPAKGSKTVASKAAAPKTLTSTEDLNIQAYVQLLRTDLNKNKSRIISDVMQFDAEQAAAFWPIYKNFQADLGKIGDQIVDLVTQYVQSYDTMTNDRADQLATKLLDIEQQRNELKRQYYLKFKTALDAITAARFLQVENQIEKLLDLQLASELPVVGPAEK